MIYFLLLLPTLYDLCDFFVSSLQFVPLPLLLRLSLFLLFFSFFLVFALKFPFVFIYHPSIFSFSFYLFRIGLSLFYFLCLSLFFIQLLCTQQSFWFSEKVELFSTLKYLFSVCFSCCYNNYFQR